MLWKIPAAWLMPLFLLVLLQENKAQVRSDVSLYFDKPADIFYEALPLGNGRIGALVFGGTKQDRIALNEISLWSGGPQDGDLPNAYRYLPAIQHYLLEKKNDSAQQLLMKHFVSNGAGTGYGNGANEKYGCYQTFGDLLIDWKDSSQPVSDYSRILDIENAVARTTFKRNGNVIIQEAFTDFENDILWVRISSQKNRKLSLSIRLYRKENVQHTGGKNGLLIMEGQLPGGKDKGLKYAAVMKPWIKQGKMRFEGPGVIVENATEVWMAISMRTNYDDNTGNYDAKANPVDRARTDLHNLSGKKYLEYQALSNRHFRRLFDACRWTLDGNQAQSAPRTTPQRLIDYAAGKADPSLPVLYFNFGRYLLIGSSRPGLLPSNLQGLWAVEYQTPWNGDYHLNINLQMNYWPAPITNLAGLSEPLHRFTANLVKNGEKTADKYYKGDGWVAHVVSNPWFFTSPGEGADWGSTLTGGAWLVTHIWENWLFTRDTSFLKQYYPVMKGAAEFLKSILIEEREHGWLVTAPSNSPENQYIMPGGKHGSTAMGPTMDMQIARNVFEAVIKSSELLQTDEAFAAALREISKRLAPNQISPTNGGIQEWLDDWPATDPHHRHVSHLFSLYPYDEITPWSTPKWSEAARKTLEMRGDGGTGWSKAWKINFWARLGDGDHALKMFKELMFPVLFNGINMRGGGTYANLFDAHPPFQIDGNFGATAGLAEMLLQSHGPNEVIRLLPALPSHPDFNKGEIKGLKARGNYTINITWEDHLLKQAQIKPAFNGTAFVQLPVGKAVYSPDGSLARYRLVGGIAQIDVQRGTTYSIR